MNGNTSNSFQPNPKIVWENIAMRNRARSPLLRLPGETRNKIYYYLLGGFEIFIPWKNTYGRKAALTIISRPKGLSNDDNDAYDMRASDAIYLPIMSVCRQIRTETRLLPFAFNDLVFRSMHATKSSLLPNLTPEQRASIHTAVIPKRCEINFDIVPDQTVQLTELLSMLPSLKRLVVRYLPPREWTHEKAVAEFKKATGNPDLEVVFELKSGVCDCAGSCRPMEHRPRELYSVAQRLKEFAAQRIDRYAR